jgi:hypothetical protein
MEPVTAQVMMILRAMFFLPVAVLLTFSVLTDGNANAMASHAVNPLLDETL